ncbi:NADH dehydrogenase [ubiquinone] (complex I), 21kDa subunit, fungi [Ceraceosorus bombacis]|uniref:NADH dehydrogenase [ubiquinone] (Complex I), 21kDa subunit, fungi n=1 Tax=Ceraceosorus bombacis TaxID=401625 RepID=A0A0P1BPB4_9BASI|nr:NADH dehydrogenase [ubiquinone] (complex I), 21kDa subunit, fungi [Ceraceosorus bombacis]
MAMRASSAVRGALRPSSCLRDAATSDSNKPGTYASSHKYTYVEGRTPFWRKFRDIFAVNPEISSGLPRPDLVRYPNPGSRPEKAALTPSRASDIAGNKYQDRDFRRMYPQLFMVTQKHLTNLLLAAPNEDGTKSLPHPSSQSTALVKAPEDIDAPSAFTDVLAQVHSPQAQGGLHYNSQNLPPRPPFTAPQHILVKNPGDIPHDPHAFFPAENYRSR